MQAVVGQQTEASGGAGSGLAVMVLELSSRGYRLRMTSFGSGPRIRWGQDVDALETIVTLALCFRDLSHLNMSGRL